MIIGSLDCDCYFKSVYINIFFRFFA